MTFSTQLFSVLLVSGLILIGAEIFVPGGVIGALGALALLAAVVVAFVAFPPAWGLYIAIAILILAAVAIFLWVKIFPKTKIGHRMTVSTDLADAKATAPHLPELLGKRGTAACELKPGGFAMIENRKVDVITRGEMIARGESVEVVKVEGCRVVVQRCGQ